MKKRLINFSEEQQKLIQAYANKKHNGNYSEAVRDLCAKALRLGEFIK